MGEQATSFALQLNGLIEGNRNIYEGRALDIEVWLSFITETPP
jgi:hypothetical protein